MKLYVIGNGFDLHHRLPTSTRDFIEIIENIDNNEYYLNAGADWNEYEEALSSFDLGNMTEQFFAYPDYLSDREADRDGVIFEMEQRMSEMHDIIDASLKEMIDNAEEIIDEICDEEPIAIENSKIFVDDSIFLSFNYTSTIERIYGVNEKSRILHIHGYHPHNEALIFGYSEPSQSVLGDFAARNVNVPGFKREFNDETYDGDYYEQQQYEEMYEFYMSNRKSHKLLELSSWVGPYVDNVDEIIVLGHSMGIVDKPYFELLEETISPDKWTISQFQNNPDETHMQKYSFACKVGFCEITDLIPPLKDTKVSI